MLSEEEIINGLKALVDFHTKDLEELEKTVQLKIDRILASIQPRIDAVKSESEAEIAERKTKIAGCERMLYVYYNELPDFEKEKESAVQATVSESETETSDFQSTLDYWDEEGTVDTLDKAVEHGILSPNQMEGVTYSQLAGIKEEDTDPELEKEHVEAFTSLTDEEEEEPAEEPEIPTINDVVPVKAEVKEDPTVVEMLIGKERPGKKPNKFKVRGENVLTKEQIEHNESILRKKRNFPTQYSNKSALDKYAPEN